MLVALELRQKDVHDVSFSLNRFKGGTQARQQDKKQHDKSPPELCQCEGMAGYLVWSMVVVLPLPLACEVQRRCDVASLAVKAQ